MAGARSSTSPTSIASHMLELRQEGEGKKAGVVNARVRRSSDELGPAEPYSACGGVVIGGGGVDGRAHRGGRWGCAETTGEGWETMGASH